MRRDQAVLLGDELWLIAHDEHSGKPKLSQRVLGLGMAAALLGELVYYRNISVQKGYVQVVTRTPPPESVAHTVLDRMAAELRSYTIRTWLVFLSRDSTELVTQRLVRAGALQAQSARRLLRQVVTLLPVDPVAAAWPMARLANALERQAPIEHTDAFLAGLALATGLDQLILDGAGSGPRRYLSHVVAGLAAPLHQLVIHTQAAVGDAVLAQRT